MEEESKILSRSLEQIDISSAQIETLKRLIEPVNLASWFETIDDSPYALDDWLLALVAFDAWLEARDINTRPIDAMLGYLECCTLTVAETLSLPDFSELTRENLERYGFDATRPASTDPEDENA